MNVDKAIIIDLIEAAMSADYTAVRRAGNVIARHLVGSDPFLASTFFLLRCNNVTLFSAFLDLLLDLGFFSK